jgi:hypothetical protein
MSLRLIAFAAILAASLLGLVSAARAGEAPAGGAKTPPLNDLSLEVAALQTLYALNLTPRQLEKLRKIAADTTDRQQSRQTPKASPKFRKGLTELRDALVKAEEDSRIDDLVKKLDDLRSSEKPELDDGVDVTDEARERAADALRLLAPSQVASYVAGMADEISDPLDLLLNALERARTVEGNEWRELREGVSEEVGRLVGGVNAEQAQSVADRVTQLLIVVRGLKEPEYKKQRAEQEKTARQIVGNAGPFEVLRHVMEQSLAELLSNPRLPQALDARLAYLRGSILVKRGSPRR